MFYVEAVSHVERMRSPGEWVNVMLAGVLIAVTSQAHSVGFFMYPFHKNHARTTTNSGSLICLGILWKKPSSRGINRTVGLFYFVDKVPHFSNTVSWSSIIYSGMSQSREMSPALHMFPCQGMLSTTR
jgi:hypothetical protein